MRIGNNENGIHGLSVTIKDITSARFYDQQHSLAEVYDVQISQPMSIDMALELMKKKDDSSKKRVKELEAMLTKEQRAKYEQMVSDLPEKNILFKFEGGPSILANKDNIHEILMEQWEKGNN